MRVDANVSVRAGGHGAFGTRCEIKNLNSLRSLVRAIEYEATRQIALIEAGGSRGPGDPALGRVGRAHRVDALQGGGQRLPLLPRARPGAAGARRRLAGAGARRRWARCRPSAAPRWPTRSAASPSDAEADQIHAVVDLGLDSLVTAATEAGRAAALALARAANEVAAQGEAGLRTRPGLVRRRCSRMEAGGQLSARSPRRCSAALLERGGGDPAALAEEWASRRSARTRWPRCSTRSSPRNPDEWARFVEGEDKLTGFFTGKVMQATSGKANGKEVAAELPAGAERGRRWPSVSAERLLDVAVERGADPASDLAGRRGGHAAGPARGSG